MKSRLPFFVLIVLLAVVSFGAGYLLHSTPSTSSLSSFGGPEWTWPWYDRDGELTDSVDDAEMRSLKGLGYLSGYEDAKSRAGIVRHDTTLAGTGLNLYTSGHGPEAVLMTMDGEVVHRWRMPWDEAFPNTDRAGAPHHWRNVHLYDNGDILAIFERHGLVKIDRNSNLIWSRSNGAHHDVWVSPSGDIYVLTAERKGMKDVDGESIPMVEDYVTKLSPEGKLLEKHSLVEAIGTSRYAGVFDWATPLRDLLHTNALEILTEREASAHPALEPGYALVSMNTINVVGAVDLETNTLQWILPGIAFEQHDPEILPNGHILMFDNNGHNWSSRVVEVDPVTQEIVWQYGARDGERFFSRTVGANQRLANGNTLIVDTTSGRAFEVTPDRTVVWKYVNPARAHGNDRKTASLFSMKRIDRSTVEHWLN